MTNGFKFELEEKVQTIGCGIGVVIAREGRRVGQDLYVVQIEDALHMGRLRAAGFTKSGVRIQEESRLTKLDEVNG